MKPDIRYQSKLIEWLINKFLAVTYHLDNTGDSSFLTNGELFFVKMLGRLYQGEHFTCFEVGANIGEYTESILTFIPSTQDVFLFEPQKSCFELLQKKFIDNEKVRLNNFGLSNEVGTMTLYKDHEGSGLASLYRRNLEHYHMSMKEEEVVSLNRADEYIKNNNISHINLIKIDVEGHEISALDGFGSFLDSKNVDYVQFEYGGANLDSHTSLMELFVYFKSRGFVVCKVMPTYLKRIEYVPRLENFMYQNYVAVSANMLE